MKQDNGGIVTYFPLEFVSRSFLIFVYEWPSWVSIIILAQGMEK